MAAYELGAIEIEVEFVTNGATREYNCKGIINLCKERKYTLYKPLEGEVYIFSVFNRT